MKRVLAAIGIAALTGTTLLSSAVAAEPAKPAPTEQARPGPGMKPGPRGPHGMDREARHARFELRLAGRLAAAETLIGIRADQLDAWRDYTSALLALVEPPAPPLPDEDAAKAFAREERLAREITERAAKAATLVRSIEVLKTTLTSDQLEKLGEVELRLMPPMWPRHGMGMGPGHGMGPKDMGPEGMGPGGMGPGGMGPGGMEPGMQGFHRGPADGAPPAPDAIEGPDEADGPGDAPQPG